MHIRSIKLSHLVVIVSLVHANYPAKQLIGTSNLRAYNIMEQLGVLYFSLMFR